jgi:hypothetical protein|mmetsp:Transcript_59698/g.99074  ORF Transcript_59698/g.99074 Transcript_59698/m.99074 type:complete len:177 (-) Transcript_59698:945-1475(-)|eukprot:CAMPEP_0174359884 /NCGR_PEP_ID=MMETSP0811_2-20130205/50961_1 /TAXON_ID=73025 ORGANISM="Eutreptiella gymnastica-like, Strain CCMP1594" /NCGR_SAMPLE_ID=MMETSP0811_2 /ASSEMBLY_ACC=CAM_ASM_000667 /LENGTH=176 /DNA_ID=CAMNT_0015495003 /DNA_START=54 /DNA_END=584 /DNA_ORIENTATION=+
MGCDSSKNRDIQESKRTRPEATLADQRSQEQPIIGASQPTLIDGASREDDFPGPESYTDRHVKETELLKEVIHRTSRKFIDIGQTPLEATTPEQPSHMHAMPARLTDGSQDILLLGLPTADEGNSVDSLSQPLVNDPDAMNEVFNYVSAKSYMSQIADVGELVQVLPMAEPKALAP